MTLKPHKKFAARGYIVSPPNSYTVCITTQTRSSAIAGRPCDEGMPRIAEMDVEMTT